MQHLSDPLVCVANKGLTQYLSPLDATFTKNRGGGSLEDIRDLDLGQEVAEPVGQAFLPVSYEGGFPVESIVYELPFCKPFVFIFIHVMGGTP